MTISEKQLLANQRNAQLSTGPRTEAGRAISSKNAIKHGLRAREAGVSMVACTMSMDLMGIKEEELIDGVEKGGVAMYLARAETADTNLFI